MKYSVLAVRDRAVDAFGQPIFVPAVGAALRSFMDEVNNEKSSFYNHPEDYDLYLLGDYDDATGNITSLDQPRMVAVGKECVKNPV